MLKNHLESAISNIYFILTIAFSDDSFNAASKENVIFTCFVHNLN